MRYQLELDIDAPRDRVSEAFLDPESLPHWQPDLISFEQIAGDGPRDVGSKSRQMHRMGKREIEIIETITVKDPPRAFAATYESDGMWNLVDNQLTETPDGRTHWVLTSECRGTSLFMRLFLLLAPGMIRGQTKTHMQHFKGYFESRA